MTYNIKLNLIRILGKFLWFTQKERLYFKAKYNNPLNIWVEVRE
jgi:hypothetical protein